MILEVVNARRKKMSVVLRLLAEVLVSWVPYDSQNSYRPTIV